MKVEYVGEALDAYQLLLGPTERALLAVIGFVIFGPFFRSLPVARRRATMLLNAAHCLLRFRHRKVTKILWVYLQGPPFEGVPGKWHSLGAFASEDGGTLCALLFAWRQGWLPSPY